MVSQLELVNYCMSAAALMLMLLGLLVSIFTLHIEHWARRFFVVFFSVGLVYVASQLFELVATFNLRQRELAKFLLFTESLSSSLLMLLMTQYLMHTCAVNRQRCPLTYLVGALWLVYLALLVVTQFTEIIYYYTPDGDYMRGPLYPLLLVPPVLIQAADLIALLYWRRKLSRQMFGSFLCYLLLPALGMILQMLRYGLLVIVFATAIGATILFVSILQEQVDLYLRLQRENARQRASIAVLQMRPHFISNTLTSIYYLIRQNPEKAQKVVLDFTSYLRKNFTAIAKEDLIPVSEELEHTRAYLAVEQVRFEGSLFVIFDTPAINFRLPALTLQPIVENAVRHGVDPELAPLYITIRTREETSAYVVRVDDSGPGFTPVGDDAPHIALANIRERLKLMCRGTLQITSRSGGGTAVTVRIPKQNAQQTLLKK